MKYRLTLILSLLVFFCSCSVSKQIAKSAKENVLKNDALQTAHVGISIYEPATGKYLYNYQGDKYFVPASNTKLPTCYAAMKYLGDSLVGLKIIEYQHNIFLIGTGDPTFLHSDFKIHPVYNFLKSLDQTNKYVSFGVTQWAENALGYGWAWNDYSADYSAERSGFPIYGNVVSFSGKENRITVQPKYFAPYVAYQSFTPNDYLSSVYRFQFANKFSTSSNGNAPKTIDVPFITSDTLSLKLLIDTLHLQTQIFSPNTSPPITPNDNETGKTYFIYSQPTDSLLKLMMHNSDNFFAEQTLLMIGNKLGRLMSDDIAIALLLERDFKDLPQKPRWIDGSGLSRYNLFTPQDFVFILNKMKTDFGMERIKAILPTGNEGTLEGRFVRDSNYIFAKTGTLSGVVSLSGFLYTKTNKLLVFSVLVNNHNSSAGEIRRAVEKFIQEVRDKN